MQRCVSEISKPAGHVFERRASGGFYEKTSLLLLDLPYSKL